MGIDIQNTYTTHIYWDTKLTNKKNLDRNKDTDVQGLIFAYRTKHQQYKCAKYMRTNDDTLINRVAICL